MRTYEEARDAARPGSPFSCGTQGMDWMDRWCDRCVHDQPARHGREEDGCPLVLVSLSQLTPAEWIADTDRDAVLGNWRCVEFRDEDYPPDEPIPLPEDPNQGVLWPREQYEGVRMLVQPEQVGAPA